MDVIPRVGMGAESPGKKVQLINTDKIFPQLRPPQEVKPSWVITDTDKNYSPQKNFSGRHGLLGPPNLNILRLDISSLSWHVHCTVVYCKACICLFFKADRMTN